MVIGWRFTRNIGTGAMPATALPGLSRGKNGGVANGRAGARNAPSDAIERPTRDDR
jgi:hypothetical protein